MIIELGDPPRERGREAELGTVRAVRCGMHPLFFSLKRTHLCVLARTRPIAQRFGLTPARFDMLRTIYLYDEWGLPQWKLVRLLGVSAPVVSRMLKQLTALGLVRRYRDPDNRRINIVHLEPEGLTRVKDLLAQHVYDADLECIAFENFAPRADWNLTDVYTRLNRARRNLNDRAPFLHPWRVADVVDDKYRFRTLEIEDVDDSIPREDVLAGEDASDPCEFTRASRPTWHGFPGEQPLAPI